MGMEIKDTKNDVLSSFNNALSSCSLEICRLKGQEVGNKGVFTSYGGTMSRPEAAPLLSHTRSPNWHESESRGEK